MRWPKNITDARTLQEQDRERIRIAALTEQPKYVAGVDASFANDRVYAAVCLYRLPDLALVEEACSVMKASFPYVPGYLFFREGPAIIRAVKRLSKVPDVILVDGQGIAHPRGIGSASHLGLLVDLPTVGCAKTLLIGEFKEPVPDRGSWSPLYYEGKVVGAVLRTRDNVRPLFVSPGYKIDLDEAVCITLACGGSYRIPEPLRCADMLSRKEEVKASGRGK